MTHPGAYLHLLGVHSPCRFLQNFAGLLSWECQETMLCPLGIAGWRGYLVANGFCWCANSGNLNSSIFNCGMSTAHLLLQFLSYSSIHLWSVMRCHIRPSMTCWKQAPSMTESEALQILLGFLQVSLEGIVAAILQQLWRKKLIEHAYPWNFWLRRWHLRDLLLCGWVDLCSGSLCLLRGAHSIERWGLEVHDSDSAVVGVLGCREVSMSMIDGFGMLQHWGQRGQEAFGQEKAVLVHASRYL